MPPPNNTTNTVGSITSATTDLVKTVAALRSTLTDLQKSLATFDPMKTMGPALTKVTKELDKALVARQKRTADNAKIDSQEDAARKQRARDLEAVSRAQQTALGNLTKSIEKQSATHDKLVDESKQRLISQQRDNMLMGKSAADFSKILQDSHAMIRGNSEKHSKYVDSLSKEIASHEAALEKLFKDQQVLEEQANKLKGDQLVQHKADQAKNQQEIQNAIAKKQAASTRIKTLTDIVEREQTRQSTAHNWITKVSGEFGEKLMGASTSMSDFKTVLGGISNMPDGMQEMQLHARSLLASQINQDTKHITDQQKQFAKEDSLEQIKRKGVLARMIEQEELGRLNKTQQADLRESIEKLAAAKEALQSMGDNVSSPAYIAQQNEVFMAAKRHKELSTQAGITADRLAQLGEVGPSLSSLITGKIAQLATWDALQEQAIKHFRNTIADIDTGLSRGMGDSLVNSFRAFSNLLVSPEIYRAVMSQTRATSMSAKSQAEFVGALDKSQDQFFKFTADHEKSAQMAASMFDGFAQIGVGSRAAASAMGGLAPQFASLSSLTGQSQSELAKLTAEMMASSDIRIAMSGLSQEEAATKSRLLLQEQQRLVLGNYTLEQARELQKDAARAALKTTIAGRATAEAKGTQALTLLSGIATSPEDRAKAQELISRRRELEINARATGMSNVEFKRQEALILSEGASLTERLASRMTYDQSKGGQQNAIEAIRTLLSEQGSAGGNIIGTKVAADTTNKDAELSRKASSGQANQEAEAASKLEVGVVTRGVAWLSDAFKAGTNNPLIMGTVIIGAMLTAGRLGAFSQLSAGSVLNSAKNILTPDKAGKVASSGKSLLSGAKDVAGSAIRSPNALKLMKGVGVGAVLGIGGDLLADYVGKETSAGKAISTLSTTASMASTGAMLGSLLGPLGTLVGGAVGGLGGLAYGLYSNYRGESTSPSSANVKNETGPRLSTLSNEQLAASIPGVQMYAPAAASAMLLRGAPSPSQSLSPQVASNVSSPLANIPPNPASVVPFANPTAQVGSTRIQVPNMQKDAIGPEEPTAPNTLLLKGILEKLDSMYRTQSNVAEIETAFYTAQMENSASDRFVKRVSMANQSFR